MAVTHNTIKMSETESENFKNLNIKEIIINNKNVWDIKEDIFGADGTEYIQNVNERKLTEIQQFYNRKNVLITGATGFLGKILVEKLLRCCPTVENLYLLVRQKKGKDICTRVEEIFDDPIFSRLKDEVPKFRHKIVVVLADCEVAGLGLTLKDRRMLTEKVNIIFHSAATVKFDEHLRIALAINVQAPLHLLGLARNMKDLNVFMHISTAYSNSHLSRIEEQFYPFEADCDALQLMVDKSSHQEIEDLLPLVLGPWPNTYTFTKALAEKEMRNNVGNVPLAIFRPAIVTSTADGPLKGWIDNIYGPTGVAVGAGTGILRTLKCNEAVTADIVPVDYVVNCLMVAAVNVHKAYKQSPPPPAPPIFNYVNSADSRITWGDFMTHTVSRIKTYPFSNAVWYLSFTMASSSLLYGLYTLFLHLIPAALVDGFARCIGKQPKMLKMYKKIHKFSAVISYFCTRQIDFCNKRTRGLWDNTSEVDRKMFPFSMSDLDWSEYFDAYIIGIRRYLFKDSDDTLPQMRVHYNRLYYLHQGVKIIICSLIVYVLYALCFK